MVSEMLHKSGIPMGISFEEGVNRSYWEDKRSLELNRRLMRHFNVPWDGRGTVDISEPTIRRMKRYINKSKEKHSGPWGFKDPRTIITWNNWKEALKDEEYKIIAVYRNPNSVTKHLEGNTKDSERKIEYFKNIWKLYNIKLINILRKEKDYILLDYDYLVDSGNISNLEDFVGKKLNNIIRKKDRHSIYNDIPEDCYSIWNELRRLGGEMITIYTLPGCSSCKELKKQLDDNYIKYSEINLKQPGLTGIKKKFKEKNIMYVPIVQVNGKLLESPTLKEIKEEL